MNADVEKLIEDLHNHADNTEEIIKAANLVMDRGNKPSIAMVDDWAAMSRESLRLLEQLRTLDKWLNPETVTEADIARIMIAQMRFNETQQNYGTVITRVKKHLGMIP